MLAEALARLGETRGACGHAQRAAELQPANAQAWSYLGAALARAGRLTAAERAFERALELKPDDAFLRAQLGDTRLSLGDSMRAVSDFEAATVLAPQDMRFRIGLANAHKSAGAPLRALAVVEEVMAKHGESAQGHAMAGDLHVALGDFAAAAARYRAALSREADHVDALLGLSRLPAEVCDLDLRGRIEARLADTKLTDEQRIGLLFALGNLLDRAEAPEPAMRCFQDANRRLREQVPSKVDAAGEALKRTVACFTAELMRRRGPAAGALHPQPIFIFGMPRSGTTLVEQIIAAQPQVRAGGELPHVQQVVQDWPDLMPGARGYPEGLAEAAPADWDRLGQGYMDRIAALAAGAAPGAIPGATFVTDKNPFNFQHLGLISLILPGARLIHCTRDPMDVCTSNFIAYYTAGQAAFSYDFEGLARYYRLYERFMAHWRAVLQVPLHEVSYERLVEDPKGEGRRLLEFCGLPWDERVLEFHTRAGPVATASDVQVRAPIHRRSVGRWRRYGAALAPLKALLEA